jgi:uncharacterized phiE125 gp8 family phage protein
VLKLAELGAADLAAARDATKLYARIAGTAEDGLITALARTAIGLCEAFCGQAVILRGAVEVLNAAAEWRRLEVAPVSAITLVEGLRAEGAAFAMPVGSYAIDIDAEGVGWVRVSDPGAAGRVRVTYQAGLATAWAELPASLAQGIVRLATHLYVHRDGADDSAPPAAVSALWRPWRRVELG